MRDDNLEALMEKIRDEDVEYKKREQKARKSIAVGVSSLLIALTLVGVLFLMPDAYKIYPLVGINLMTFFMFSSMIVLVKNMFRNLKDIKRWKREEIER